MVEKWCSGSVSDEDAPLLTLPIVGRASDAQLITATILPAYQFVRMFWGAFGALGSYICRLVLLFVLDDHLVLILMFISVFNEHCSSQCSSLSALSINLLGLTS